MANGSKETDAISSMCNGYGLSKWAAEKIVTDSSEAFGLAFSTFRMGNLSQIVKLAKQST